MQNEFQKLELQNVDSIPTWTDIKTRSLSNQCRAGVIDHWASNIERRHGTRPVLEIIKQIPQWETVIQAPIDHKKWIPVAAHLELVQTMKNVLGKGSFEPIIDDFIDDLRLNMGKIKLFALRRIGPAAVIKTISSIHKETYQDGTASCKIARRTASIHFKNASFMAHPTWQILQLATLRALVELSKRTLLELYGEQEHNGFVVSVCWK